MSELKGYRCPNCGDMLKIPKYGIYKCESCGSEFEKEHDTLRPIRVEVCKAIITTLGAKATIPDEAMRYPELREQVIRGTLEELSRELAAKIIPFMEVHKDQDPDTFETRISARVHLADKRN